MRFFENGPSIPDDLLERRDQGRVVFLCGAGVSLHAGMPTFYGLTKHVIDFFDPPKNSTIAVEFSPWVEDFKSNKERPKTPLDQIFNLLYSEYGRDEVNAIVVSKLQGGESELKNSDQHQVIARISSDLEGNAQIVTTNFDLLFEQAIEQEVIKVYEPPAFPDIGLGVPLTGITYLHGRLQEEAAKLHPYVLSSADFGRAYLSEGWATNFIRLLLKSYTVVLLGYQAEDLPVKYLLQGLNHDGLSDRSSLYAFDVGKIEDIETKWRDRGVTVIPCNDYTSLWETLGAWADRADDPRKWRSSVVDMAMKGPLQLEAHERGQVAHLVRTTPGARLFANSTPSPPPEWLCVFDSGCRAGKESSNYGSGETFDPLDAFGLDDDPSRPLEPGWQSNSIYGHILEWRKGDINPPDFHNLSNRQAVGFENLPPRLSHLSNWIYKHIDKPVVAWWAARQNGLHPVLLRSIQIELRRNKDLHPAALRTWNLIVEYQTDSRILYRGEDWFEIKARISNEGWTSSVIRQFALTTAPILSMESPLGLEASKPPLGDWEENSIRRIAKWAAKFPDRYRESVDVPNEVLDVVFRISEGHFRQLSGLIQDTGTNYISSPTCYPNRDVDGADDKRHEVFKWFLQLFERMVLSHPDTLRAYATSWPVESQLYFGKLKLFALNQTELFTPEEAAKLILSLSQESFWDSELRRELLFLISDRWESFSMPKKEELVKRLLKGPDKMDYWSVEEYQNSSLEMACRYTSWLVQQDKILPDKQANQLSEMKSKLPEWDDSWVQYLTKKDFGSVRSIGINENPEKISNLPINKIVKTAQSEHRRDFDSHTDKRPFTGLVKINPRKALASLSYSAKHGSYPKNLWHSLIIDWPADTSPRLFRVFLLRLGKLPVSTIRELSFPVGQWLEENLLKTFKFDKSLAWKTFDGLVFGLISKDGIDTKSGIGTLRRGGKIVKRSRRTIDHAINGSIGYAMQGLLHTLDSLKLGQEAGMPEEFKSRLETLISAPGEGGDHAVVLIARQISWLFYLDPKWVNERVIPWFAFEHDLAEPAWNGYLSASSIPAEKVGAALKPYFLDLFPRIYQWSWDDNISSVAAQILVELTVFHSDKPDGFDAKEARYCIRNMNDRNRGDVIFRLQQIGQQKDDGWVGHVIPFVNSIWPREIRFRTSSLVKSWLSLLHATDDNFPKVLSVVRRHLVPIREGRHWLKQYKRELNGGGSLSEIYPAHVLELFDAVIPNTTEDLPYGLAEILAIVEESDSTLSKDKRFRRLSGLIEQT